MFGVLQRICSKSRGEKRPESRSKIQNMESRARSETSASELGFGPGLASRVWVFGVVGEVGNLGLDGQLICKARASEKPSEQRKPKLHMEEVRLIPLTCHHC